jgi:thymidylate synthase ThyX
MKATVTFISPPNTGEEKRPSFCPELNAAVAARHSRCPDGLDKICEIIDSCPSQDIAIDRIFNQVDYGHRSICDMVPLSVHIEGVSLWLAEFVWGLVHTGGGQETSTRYCNFASDGLYVPEDMEADQLDDWKVFVHESLSAYDQARSFWSRVAKENPSVVGIKDGMEEKVADRFRRNFVFDRSRYFIPSCCLTNMNITTWGTEWIRIIQALLSSPWPEAFNLGFLVRDEVSLGAPRLIRHAKYREALAMEYKNKVARAASATDLVTRKVTAFETQRNEIEADHFLYSQHLNVLPFLDAGSEASKSPLRDMFTLERSLGARDNRYDFVGTEVSSVPVKYGWTGVAMAEIRDMNRHRPGVRHITLAPEGFYFASDQISSEDVLRGINETTRGLRYDLQAKGIEIAKLSLGLSAKILASDRPHNVVYSVALGNTFSFSHTSTFGHLIYECELRTGPGTHFRYRDHYLGLLQCMYKQFPLLKRFVLEGKGEPE